MRVQLELPGMPEPDESLRFHSPDTDPPEGESSVVPYGDQWLARINDEGFCPAFLWETEALAIAWVEFMKTNNDLDSREPEKQMSAFTLSLSGMKRSADWNHNTQRFEKSFRDDEETFSLLNSALKTAADIRGKTNG